MLRAENVEWNPLVLTFVLKRHGAVKMGSSKAELQHWAVDLDQRKVTCVPYGFQKIADTAPPFRAEKAAVEIAGQINSRSSDWRLEWTNEDRSEVRVLVTKFVDADVKETRTHRRKKFRIALEQLLNETGWASVKRDLFRRMQ